MTTEAPTRRWGRIAARIFGVLLTILLGIIVFRLLTGGTPPPTMPTSARDALPAFTADQLRTYDGTNPTKPILLGMEGYVYDVTAGGPDFYAPGQAYHSLAGRDASVELRIAGGGIIAKKYPVVGRLVPPSP